jgi:hypothetical protein
VVAQEALPGAAGLTGSFDATETRGELSSRRAGCARIQARVRRSDSVDSLRGVVIWEPGRAGEGRRRTLDFANAHTAGSIAGTSALAQGPGEPTFRAARVDPNRFITICAATLIACETGCERASIWVP